MILKGEQAIEGLYHLLKPVVPAATAVTVIHDRKRYGGFRDANHAAFVARALAWKEYTVLVPVR